MVYNKKLIISTSKACHFELLKFYFVASKISWFTQKNLSDSRHWRYRLQNVLQPFKCVFSIFLTWGCSPLFNIEWKVECLTPKTPKAWVNSFWSLLFLPMASSVGAPSSIPPLLSPSSSSYLQAKRPENENKICKKTFFLSRVPEINEWV